jgi:hypothetical protein
MEKEEQKRIILITFVLSLACIIILLLFQVKLVSIKGVKTALSIPAILTLWWAFYFRYGWKVPMLNKILYKENINGTWFGTYESREINNENNRYNGDISLVIKQSFLTLNITSSTEKYKNYSYIEMLTLNKKSDTTKLVYVYSQEEVNAVDHFIRKGTSELGLTLNNEKSELYGKFWTNNGTLGQLKLTHISKEYIEFFENARTMAKKGGNL